MSSKKGGFQEILYSSIMPKIYGIGASIVIVGALFKIEHFPFASEMLMIGLSTEALIFLLSAFEPRKKDPDWSKVYPELAEGYVGAAPKKVAAKSGESSSQKLDKMLEKSKIGQELIDSLGKGMRSLADSATKMTKLSDATVATSAYAKNVQSASKSLTDLNKSYASTVNAMTSMANATKDAKEYHTQVQNVTKNLSTLNSIYELELKDTDSHLKAMNKFYSNISSAMENVAAAGKETDQFRSEITKLTQNLTALNNVYGNMLTAMKGGK